MIPMGRKSNLALGNTPACPVTQSENLDQFLMIHLSKWKAIGNFSHQWPRADPQGCSCTWRISLSERLARLPDVLSQMMQGPIHTRGRDPGWRRPRALERPAGPGPTPAIALLGATFG